MICIDWDRTMFVWRAWFKGKDLGCFADRESAVEAAMDAATNYLWRSA